jgi:hypothetical protein
MVLNATFNNISVISWKTIKRYGTTAKGGNKLNICFGLTLSQTIKEERSLYKAYYCPYISKNNIQHIHI